MRFFRYLILCVFVLFSVSSNAQNLTTQDKECLTKALYHEARGEPHKGIVAVASVILNRIEADGYPDSVCGVIEQKGQFTYDKRKKMTEESSVAKIKYVVASSEDNLIPKYPFLYFHRVDVPGPCSNKKNRVVIGNHFFCR